MRPETTDSDSVYQCLVLIVDKKAFLTLELNKVWPYDSSPNFEVSVLHTLYKTLSPTTLRLSLLAWVLVFVCGQTLAANHLHIDSHASDEVCAVCIHAQDHSIIDSVSTSSTHSTTYIIRANFHASLPQASAPCAYLSRAPPQA